MVRAMMADPFRQVERVIVTDVLKQTVKVLRREGDGTVWLYAPQGVALSADEAWAVAQAMLNNPEPGPVDGE